MVVGICWISMPFAKEAPVNRDLNAIKGFAVFVQMAKHDSSEF